MNSWTLNIVVRLLQTNPANMSNNTNVNKKNTLKIQNYNLFN